MSDDWPMFLEVEALRQRINPKIGADRFKAKLSVLHRDGFPKKSEVWGGWYWPAVREWLDKHNKVENDAGVTTEPEPEDGREDFNAGPRRKTRVQTRQAQPAVLDREAGGAGHQGFPRQVHPSAAKR